MMPMHVPLEKRYEYWNHFVTRWVIDKFGGGHGITPSRLSKVALLIMADEEFWADIILRHGGDSLTPEQMLHREQQVYEHCAGNFWGMIYQTLVEHGFIPVK